MAAHRPKKKAAARKKATSSKKTVTRTAKKASATPRKRVASKPQKPVARPARKPVRPAAQKTTPRTAPKALAAREKAVARPGTGGPTRVVSRTAKTAPPPPPKPAAPPPKQARPVKEVYRLYEKAVSLLHRKQYREARELFLAIADRFPEEIEVLDRVNAFLRICESHLRKRREAAPATAEEFFDRGVIHHNAGQYHQALEAFSAALKLTRRDSAYIHYAIAAAEVHLGNHEKALKSLKRAIELKEEHRFFARNDPDFEPLTQNRKFLELIRSPKPEGE